MEPLKKEIKILQSERMHLRAVEPADIHFLFELENDPLVWRAGNTITPFSKYQIEQYVFSSQHDIYAEKQLRLMIDIKSTETEKKCIGAIDIFDFDPHHRRAGIGILILPEEREKGYAFEAIELLKAYASEILQLHQLYCSILTGNAASISLFQKLGFVQCGLKKEWRYQDNQWADEMMFQFLFSSR